jgi:4-hydroxy-2-oxoheptanedioate aldolase
VPKANAETLIVLHIETIEAVEHLHDIINVDGVDVIFIGPTDLSHSLGVPGQPQHPSVQAAMQRVIDIVSKTNVALGTLVPNAKAAQDWKKRGARYLAIGLEALLTPAAKEFLQAARA